MKVAMLTTIGEGCGIAAYSRWLVDALREVVDVVVQPIKEGNRTADHHRAQAQLLNMADLVHIQHEHTSLAGTPARNKILIAGQKLGNINGIQGGHLQRSSFNDAFAAQAAPTRFYADVPKDQKMNIEHPTSNIQP